METYLYFRGVAAIDADDDGTAGSLLMPLSRLKGMCMGTGAIDGAISNDADAFTLFFEPAGIGSVRGDGDAGDNDVDAVIIAIKTDNEPQPVMQAIVEAVNSHPNSDGFITIYDSIAGVSVHADIEGVTTARAVND
tara:strand:- start:458 stop:865 length:408 start_codon:yes stop_codon:yes gene_type:complete